MAATAWNAAPALARDLLGDERLARLAGRGDERAFGALYERYRPDLERYCRSILRNGADAEDAAQNAMLAALRALEAGTVPMRVKPWLYKIAHNEAITVARRRRPVEELDERTLGAGAEAEDASAVRERLGQLLSDLKALTERQREALVLRELCGLSYSEIAQTLGSSEAAAHQTVFEARSALQAFGEGRALDCERIQRAMSDCDGMRLRTRRYRAHVRGCECCREFEASLLARRRDLGLLFPPGAGATGLAAALVRLLGLGGGGERLAGVLGLKGAIVGAALLAGGGAVIATSNDPGRPNSRPAGVWSPTAGVLVASPAGGAQAGAAQRAAGTGTGHRGKAGHAGQPHRGATKPTTPAGTHTSPAANTPAPADTGSAGATNLASTNHGDPGGTGTNRHTDPTTPHGPVPGHGPAPDTVNSVVDSVGHAVTNTAGDVTQTANQVAGEVTQQVQQTAATVGDTVTSATEAASKVVGGASLP